MTKLIAVSESKAGSMVLLFKSLRGYAGGNVEPVDFHSVRNGTCDESLAALGFQRVTEWQAVPNMAGSHFATVEEQS